MHSTEATPQGGKISRPVSPKTIPPRGGSADSSSSSSTNNKEARPAIHPLPSTTTNTNMPHSPTSHHRRIFSSPSSSYILALQTLDPRPLHELHNERSYLLHDLQKQGDRATRLFHRYAAVEARLGTAARSAAETKRCRREASLVRAKIAESTQQEQLILLRLGEIHVELQNRERWMLVHHHHHHHQPLVFQPPLVFPPSPPPLSALSSLPPLWLQQQPTLSSSLGDVWSLSPCQEQKYEDTPVTDRSSSDYFSTCGSPLPPPSAVLSPLSPCFTPGVVFAEDIWSRAASRTSEAEEGDGEVGEEGHEEGERGGGGEEGESTPITKSVDGTDEMGQEGESEVRVGQGQLERGCSPEGKSEEGVVVEVEDAVLVQRGDDTATPDTTNRSCSSSSGDGYGCGEDGDGDPQEDTQAWRARLRRVSLYFPLSGRAKEKRMSLPYLKGMWSRSRRASLQSTVG